jgi:hypothetical protein
MPVVPALAYTLNFPRTKFPPVKETIKIKYGYNMGRALPSEECHQTLLYELNLPECLLRLAQPIRTPSRLLTWDGLIVMQFYKMLTYLAVNN